MTMKEEIKYSDFNIWGRLAIFLTIIGIFITSRFVWAGIINPPKVDWVFWLIAVLPTVVVAAFLYIAYIMFVIPYSLLIYWTVFGRDIDTFGNMLWNAPPKLALFVIHFIYGDWDRSLLFRRNHEAS